MPQAKGDREPIRVAAFMNTEIVSGPGRQLAALVEPLRRIGVHAVVICPLLPDAADSPYTRFLRESGVEFVVVRTNGKLRPALVRAVRQAIDSIGPDVVQTHSYRPAFIAWRLRARGAPWRWIGFFHGETHEDLKVRAYNWMDTQILRHADAVVVVASTQLARFRRRRVNVSQIPNAVLPAAASSAPVPAPFDTDLPRPLLGFVGRLSHEKGMDVLLHAMAALAARGRPVSLVVAGDGPERAESEALAERLGIAAHVRFLGTVRDVSTLYLGIDLLVLPSRTEGMPNTLLEAARLDVPMVATAVGDVPAILSDPLAGLTVPPDDPTALANAIDRALLTGRSDAGKAARAAIAGRFSLDERARQHAALYARLLERDAVA